MGSVDRRCTPRHVPPRPPRAGPANSFLRLTVSGAGKHPGCGQRRRDKRRLFGFPQSHPYGTVGWQTRSMNEYLIGAGAVLTAGPNLDRGGDPPRADRRAASRPGYGPRWSTSKRPTRRTFADRHPGYRMAPGTLRRRGHPAADRPARVFARGRDRRAGERDRGTRGASVRPLAAWRGYVGRRFVDEASASSCTRWTRSIRPRLGQLVRGPRRSGHLRRKPVRRTSSVF